MRAAISDQLPDPIRVVVVAGTGLLRSEILASFGDDFQVVAVADGRAAAEAACTRPHALVVVGDDLFNSRCEDVVQRVKVACRASWRVAVLVMNAHEQPDLVAAYHAGADDVARWPLEPDMFRARVRSMV